MERSPAVGVILCITALVVLIPVLLQLRARERHVRDVWGHFVFVSGLLGVAAAYGLFSGTLQRQVAVAGLVAALVGLFIQHRDRDAEDSR